MKVKRLRILIVEDDESRVECFKKWLPPDVLLTHAPRGGSALGLLQRDRGAVYSGILLDHDLNWRAIGGVDDRISGSQVALAIVRYVEPGVPILVHSMNGEKGPQMAKLLDSAGFPVTRIPMKDLDQAQFMTWLEEVRSFYDDGGEA
jgi:CheY-like chemotaxis protein